MRGPPDDGLPGGFDAALGGAVAGVLREAGVDRSALEASVRIGADGGLRGGRLNVERPTPGLDRALADALGLTLPDEVVAMREAAAALGLPSIVGVDVHRPAVKRYVNASDASVPVRRRLAARLGVEAGALDAPHVVGVNATPTGLERKLYRQHGSAVEAAAPLSERARTVAAATTEADLGAGAIVAWDLDHGGALTPRTLFVALRDAPDAALDAALGGLPGGSLRACRAALPFDADAPCFLGVAADQRAVWTLYFKPRGSVAPTRLEPVAVFRAGDAELALHLEPDRPDRRAYARVGGRALSYRIREGAPPREAVVALLDWAAAQLAAGTALDTPPPPWARAG